MELIEILVEDRNEKQHKIQIPTDMGLTLMEVLKANEYPILATCGGIALCATCHIEVVEDPGLKPLTDSELNMLDALPNASDNSRLACQLPITKDMHGVKIKLVG